MSYLAIRWTIDPEKNVWLIANRGISFEQIIALIEAGKLRQILQHPNPAKYPGQVLYEIDVDGDVHIVPVTPRGSTLFLEPFTRAGKRPGSEERKGEVKKREFYDAAEQQLVEAYEQDEFRPVKNQKAARRAAVEAARRYLRKDARINIRLSAADLGMIKRRAVKEGLPYQTLIASVLHKYASGRTPAGKKAS